METWNVDSSPFAGCMETNNSPSDIEMQGIRDYIQRPCDELKRVEREIEAIQKSLDMLKEKRHQISHFIEKHLALVSPIRRLPDEVLSEIFLASLPRTITFSRTEAPMLISWICHRWREVAIGMPLLWSTVHVTLPGRHSVPSTSQLTTSLSRIRDLRYAAFQEWMARAKDTQSLTLSIVDNRSEDPSAESLATPIAVTLLAPFLSRIRSLTTSDFFTPEKTIAEYFLPSQMARLEHISAPFGESMVNEHSILRSPNLRDVRLEQVDVTWRELPLRWDQLIRLELFIMAQPGRALSEADLLDLIEHCPLLEWLNISVPPPNWWDSNQPDPAYLSRRPPSRTVRSDKLRHLSLLEGESIWMDVIYHMAFPRLTELSLAFADPCHNIAETMLFRQASTSLRRLSIVANRYPSLDLIRLLWSLKTLETLTIKSSYRLATPVGDESFGFNDRVLGALIPNPGSTDSELEGTIVCPALTSLIDTSNQPQWCGDTLLSVVRARNSRDRRSCSKKAGTSVPARLKHITLYSSDILGPETRSVLDEYMEDGLKLRFLTDSLDWE